jgi:hypothetical protein
MGITTITRNIVGHEQKSFFGKVGMNRCKVGNAVAEHWIRIAPHTVISIYKKRTSKKHQQKTKAMSNKI